MGSPHSDDGGERPVRKQLSKASIEPTPQDSVKENTSGRKRSFEESRDNAEDYHEDGQVRKKRSRESTPDEPEQKQAGSKDESAGPQEVSIPVSPFLAQSSSTPRAKKLCSITPRSLPGSINPTTSLNATNTIGPGHWRSAKGPLSGCGKRSIIATRSSRTTRSGMGSVLAASTLPRVRSRCARG